jgi:lipoprotein-anchoring transpeptidase ErfK/SrfK
VQTIKTAVVVVLLLVVVYGAYIAINGSQTELPEELKRMLAEDTELDIDVSSSLVGKSEASTLKPSAGLKPAQGLPTSNPLASGSSNFWNKPNDGSSASTSTPEALAPPKLATLPSFPSANGSGDPSKMTSLPTPPAPLKWDDPNKPPVNSFQSPTSNSNPADSSLATEFATSPLKPLNTPPVPSAFSPPPSLSVPAKLTAQSTSPNNLESPNDANPLNAETEKESLAVEPVKKANLTGRSYDNAKKTAMEMVDRNDFKGALATMSVFYNSPELSAEQSLDLLNLLDSLAGETIYSRRPLLETPYVVGPGESIESIAKRYEIPAELLGKINAVDPTIGPIPGTKLKVFQGPFRAEVDVQRHEMTVFLGDLYAGRFPISTGADPQPKEGVFQVVDKQKNRNYYGKGGLQIDGNDPRNPYGGWWIDLGQDLSIHGSPNAQASENNSLGCISLSPLDAGDVFSMLSRGSQVTIKR